jgi:putative cobalt transporter subunit CbtB
MNARKACWKSDPATALPNSNGTRNPKEQELTDIALSPEIAVAKPIPLGELWPWLVLGTLLALIAIYFVGTEQGATSLISGTFVHEWVHDSRHLLGFPCH